MLRQSLTPVSPCLKYPVLRPSSQLRSIKKCMGAHDPSLGYSLSKTSHGSYRYYDVHLPFNGEHLQQAQWRFESNAPIFRTIYLEILPDFGQPMKKSSMHVGLYLEHLQILLLAFHKLSTSEAIYVLTQTLLGYEALINKFGAVNVSPHCIGINRAGECKVWLSKYLQNMDCEHPAIKDQFSIVSTLLKIVQQYSLQDCQTLFLFLKNKLASLEKCDYSSGLIFESVNLALREFVIQNSVALPKNLAHMIKSEESRKEAHEERRALKVLKNNNAEREGQKLSIYKRGIATVKDVKSFKFILNSQKLAGLESQKYSRATEKIITPSGNMRRDSVSFCGRSNHNNLTSSEGIEDNKSQDKSVSPNRKNFQITSPVFKGNESDVRKYNQKSSPSSCYFKTFGSFSRFAAKSKCGSPPKQQSFHPFTSIKALPSKAPRLQFKAPAKMQSRSRQRCSSFSVQHNNSSIKNLMDHGRVCQCPLKEGQGFMEKSIFTRCCSDNQSKNTLISLSGVSNELSDALQSHIYRSNIHEKTVSRIIEKLDSNQQCESCESVKDEEGNAKKNQGNGNNLKPVSSSYQGRKRWDAEDEKLKEVQQKKKEEVFKANCWTNTIKNLLGSGFNDHLRISVIEGADVSSYMADLKDVKLERLDRIQGHMVESVIPENQ